MRFRSWFIFSRVQKLKSKVNTEIRTVMLSMHCTGNGIFYASGIIGNGMKFILKGEKTLAQHSVNVESFMEHSLLVQADFYILKEVCTFFT